MAVASHSLWLVPERRGATFAQLRRLIESLARRFDTDAFDPHVTLLGSFVGEDDALAERAQALAARLQRWEIVLGAVISCPSSPNRYQRLFAEVEPTEPLTQAHAAARALFGATAADTYAPHVSLAYADATPAQFEALRRRAVRAGVAGTGFEVRALELWRTEGAVVEWRAAGWFPLR